jgi:8-oxo-dGTP diphosphatase
MKIGLYGGSFNPVHNEHVKIMRKVLEKGIVDELWLLPCKNHAFNKYLAPYECRVEMLKEAIEGMSNIKISYVESSSHEQNGSNEPNYTSDTLKKLRKDNPDKIFYLVAGTDVVNELDMWHDNDYVRETTPFIVATRKGFPLKEGVDVWLEDIINVTLELSSTDVRERIANGESISGMVPKNVEKYILDNNLYKNTMKNSNPGTTVDMIVNIDDGLLFVKRKFAPFKGYWAFPGGYLENGKETLEEAAVRELREETSIIAKPSDLELLNNYSAPDRDPRGHVISHAYVVKNYTGELHANDDALEVRVFKTKPDNLAFDHSKIYDDYILKYKNNK